MWLWNRRKRNPHVTDSEPDFFDTEATTILGDNTESVAGLSDEEIQRNVDEINETIAQSDSGGQPEKESTMTDRKGPDIGPNPAGSSPGDSVKTLSEMRREEREASLHKGKDRKRLAWIILAVMAVTALLMFLAKDDHVEPISPKPITPQVAIQTAPEQVVPEEAKPEKAESEQARYYTFVKGDTMFLRFGKAGAFEVQKANPNIVKDMNVIRIGDTVVVPEGVAILKPSMFRIVDCAKTPKGYCEYRNPGGDRMCGVRSHEKALTSPREYGLTAEQAATVMGEKGERVLLPVGTKLNALSFGHGHWQGPVVLMKEMWAHRKTVIDGNVYLEFDACCNLATMEVPPEPEDPEPPSAPVEEPPPAAPQPPEEPKELEEEPPPAPPPLSAFPAENEFEWELIAGAGLWDNRLAHGTWQYAEGALLWKLRDGYAVGAGFFGMRGEGESEASAYEWKESAGFGPQLVLKRNYRTEQEDEFGQTVLLPAGWTLKLRFLDNDKVSGGDPVSGYHMTQRGEKLGLYTEYYERRSLDWLWGVNAEKWWYGDGDIQSTWSGDKPQDRGSWNANVYAQYRINDDWQARGIAGVSHQNWDRLNYLNLTAEARYKETLMFGPRVSLALNKPDTYRDIGRGDLTTLGAFVRLELGGVIREKDRQVREESVQYVGSVTEEETPLDARAPDAPVPAVEESETTPPPGLSWDSEQ